MNLGLVYRYIFQLSIWPLNLKYFLSIADVVAETKAALVEIGQQRMGVARKASGFIVHEDGLILTNAHVVRAFPGQKGNTY